MRLYLVRHAHAVTDEESPVRPLSPRGQADLDRLIAFFQANRQFTPAQLWHSPLVRARETALRLGAALAPEAILVETPGLLPDDDPLDAAARLDEHDPAIGLALVGHEPHLSALATVLTRGRPRPVIFHLRKAAVIALERTDARHKKTALTRWRVRWHLSPELLPPKPPPPAPLSS